MVRSEHFIERIECPLHSKRPHRTHRKTLKMAAPLFAAAIVTLGPIAADAASRHCKGVYAWETTGGSIKGSFAQFEGRGTCGSAVLTGRLTITAAAPAASAAAMKAWASKRSPTSATWP